jgi:outer membrane murein-binding lipoprotein Lpp
MGISAKWAAALAVAVAFAIGACADPQQVSEIKAKVDEIQAQQKDIVAKLEGLSQGRKKTRTRCTTFLSASRTPRDRRTRL